MARVTVEDCLERVPNRFALTILTTKQTHQLAQKRGKPFVKCDNKSAVTSLREIADGKIYYTQDVRGEVEKYLADMRARGAKLSVRHHSAPRPEPETPTTEE